MAIRSRSLPGQGTRAFLLLAVIACAGCAGSGWQYGPPVHSGAIGPDATAGGFSGTYVRVPPEMPAEITGDVIQTVFAPRPEPPTDERFAVVGPPQAGALRDSFRPHGVAWADGGSALPGPGVLAEIRLANYYYATGFPELATPHMVRAEFALYRDHAIRAFPGSPRAQRVRSELAWQERFVRLRPNVTLSELELARLDNMRRVATGESGPAEDASEEWVVVQDVQGVWHFR